MDVLSTPHPFSGFDLTAIGIVLVVVMVILGMRRLLYGSIRPRRADLDTYIPEDQEDGHDPR